MSIYEWVKFGSRIFLAPFVLKEIQSLQLQKLKWTIILINSAVTI